MHRLSKEHPTNSTTPPPSLPPVPPQSYHQQPPLPPSLTQYATGINPSYYVAPQPVNANWSTGICACCSDIPNCCITYWCPCITFGQLAEIVDRGNTSCVVHGVIYASIRFFTGLACIYSAMYRRKMRSQFGLRESPCNDYLLHIFCESRALCQEYRELKYRGFDFCIGWQGNEGRQNHGVQIMPPMVPQGMHR
ncbi:protein PLANT CADMIUM RESISTANCE 2-like [Bidens hawaiensis]|uniref:protein PLANT CADMIUM RESISTANCE 2-like n=1 Tax=Bidens hawaiensis TaxID=980011 RepID=UPI00404B42E5